MLVLALAWVLSSGASPAGAQPTGPGPTAAAVAAEPAADAFAGAAPRTVVIAAPLPPIPAQAPDRFVVLPFENRSGVRALDWLVAGAPAGFSEKLEYVIGLDPGGGDLLVSGAPAEVTPASAARAGRAAGARWVVSGWATRTNWQLDLSATLWRVDLAGTGDAEVIATLRKAAPFADVHAVIGETLAEFAARAGWRLDAAAPAQLVAAPTPDLYAFTLLGRGLGRLTGALTAAGPAAPGAPAAITAADAVAAERDLARVVFIDPSFALGQRLVGEVWRRYPIDEKQARRAIGKFNYALDLQPRDVLALRASAAAALEDGKATQARELFERWVRLRPWDLRARQGLGEAAWGQGDGETARRELGAVLAAEPGNLAARRVLALVHAASGDSAALIAELEAIRGLAPDDDDALVNLAAAYAARSMYPQALAAFAEAVARRPQDVSLKLRLADVARWAGDGAAAGAAYAAAQETAPDDPRAYFLGAALASASGDFDGAKRVLIRAQRLKDLLPYTQYALGVVEVRRAALTDAVWYLQRAAKARPQALAPRLALITAHLLRGDLPSAEAQLAAAATGWPSSPERRYLAGFAALARGARADARAVWAEAIGHAPSQHAIAALDIGGAPPMEPVLPSDAPVGDVRELAERLGAFTKAAAALGELRDTAERRALAVLAVLGEGPAKPPKSPPRTRVCPLARLVRPWRDGDAARARFVEAGLAVEAQGVWLARADQLGDGAGLLPHQRVELATAVRELTLARRDLRDLSALWTIGLGRELAYVRCRPELLAAAIADPKRYPAAPTPPPPPPRKSEPPLPPRRATFYVDNRSCAEPFTIYVDGQRVGEAPGGERRAASAPVGRRAVCLLPPGRSVCGDRGTVREVYLHDAWEVVMKCPPAEAPTP